MKKLKALIGVLAAGGACSLLAGCAGKIVIDGLEDKYFSEYGEMYVLPTPEIKGSEEEYTWEVYDSNGNAVLDALFGSFYPEIGDYTMKCVVGNVEKTVLLECRDTLGPKVEAIGFESTVFEGDRIVIPTFVATDVSGISGEGTLVIYKDEAKTQRVVLEEGQKEFTAEEGVANYYFVYTTVDTIGNVTESVLVTKVREQFIDSDIDENTIFDFDEDGYVNLVAESSKDSTLFPEFEIVTGGVEGITGGALKLTASEAKKYVGVNLVRGNTINSGECFIISLRVFATSEISLFEIQPKKETLAPISFANIPAGEWKTLKFSSHQLSPDNIDIDSLDIRFTSQESATLYIDEIKGVPLSEDPNISKNYLADFDEELYLNNIEQAGYEIGNGQITAEYSIVQEADMPELAKSGTSGGALKVKVNDVWVADYAGYGVLGDGVKYNLATPFNTSELKDGGLLSFNVFCEVGNALALSFTYKNPITGALLRSKARWVRGVEGDWTTIKLDYQLITQIVPYSPISNPDGGKFEDFDITAIVITTCGNLPVDEADMKKGYRDPCLLFYLDSMRLVRGKFVDENLADGLLADFDEEDYSDSITQAWTYVAVSSEIKHMPAGSEGLPEGTNGGAVWCKAHYIDDVVYPNQGARGDGVRYLLSEPILASDLDEVSIKLYAVTGTACYVGYVVKDKDGVQVQRQGYWENCANGEGAWSTIVQDKARLGIRLQPTDQIIAILVYARGDGLNGATSLSEFYLDEIGVKTSKSYIWNDTTVLQSTEGWNGSQKGGAVINVLNYEDRSTKNLLGKYPYSGAGSIKVPNFLAGLSEGDVVLEVVSRHSPTVSYCDGAKVTFNNKLDFGSYSKLQLDMYATANTHGGYGFYVKDSAGHMYTWRIQTSDYNGAYSWTTLSINLDVIKSAGLIDIKSIDLVAVGNSLDTGMTCTYAAYKNIKIA